MQATWPSGAHRCSTWLWCRYCRPKATCRKVDHTCAAAARQCHSVLSAAPCSQACVADGQHGSADEAHSPLMEAGALHAPAPL